MANNKEEVKPVVYQITNERLEEIEIAADDLIQEIKLSVKTFTENIYKGKKLLERLEMNDIEPDAKIPVSIGSSIEFFYNRDEDSYLVYCINTQFRIDDLTIEQMIYNIGPKYLEAKKKNKEKKKKAEAAGVEFKPLQSYAQLPSAFIGLVKIWFYFVSDRLRQMDFTAQEVFKCVTTKNVSLNAILEDVNEKMREMGKDENELLKPEIFKVNTGDEDTDYSICILTNADVKQKPMVIEKKTSTKALEVTIEKFWRNNIQSFLTIINTVLQPIGDKEIDKQIEKFNNMDKKQLFKIVNKSYEFKNNHFLKVGVRISESGLDKIKTATVKWEDMFKRSLLYCLVFKLKNKMKQKDAEDYLTDKLFKKAIKVFNLGKEARERNQDKTKKEELRQKIKDDYGDLEWIDDYLTSSGLVFENSICGKNNTIANKIFGVVDKSFFEQSDEYLDRVWKSCGGDGSSGSSQACFDLIDLKRKIIVECKDYNIDLVRAHNVNIQAKLRYLMECKAKLNKACILKNRGEIVNYLTILSNTIEFDRGFYNECDYIGFGMTINKFQPIKDKIEEIKRTKDTSYTQVNTIERWEEVARHQDNQRYFPVISNSRKVARIVKKKNKGESDAINQLVNETLHEDMGNRGFEYLFIISVDVGENRTRATAIYDYTQDDVLRNPFPLSTYKAIQNDKGFFQMVKIPIDKFKPRVVEVD